MTLRAIDWPILLQGAALVYPSDARGWLRGRGRFLMRALTTARSHAAWLARLQQADLQPLLERHPRLAEKLQRPYLRSNWEAGEKVAALTAHYDQLAWRFGAESTRRIYSEGLPLTEFVVGASHRRLQLRADYFDQFEKEGEMTLTLRDGPSGIGLVRITILFADDAIWIGGLQSDPDERTRLTINEVTKDLHGMRPKAFALWCLRMVAEGWGYKHLRAVGDEIHIYRHRQKRRDFAASYNEFWQESGGWQLSDGSWVLPVHVPQRPRAEVKPSRRKAHELRYGMLEGFLPLVRMSVESLVPV